MPSTGLRLIACAIVVLAGTIAIGLGEMARDPSNGVARMVGGWVLGVGALAFILEFFWPRNLDK